MITVFHQVDLGEERVAGGIDSFIRDFVQNGKNILVLGATRRCNSRRGFVVDRTRSTRFLPVVKLPPHRRMLPDSLRMIVGLLRSRRLFTGVVHLHRIDYVLPLKAICPKTKVVLFIHTDSRQTLGSGSDSLWRYLRRVYQLYERVAIRLPEKVMVFSSSDIERLKRLRSDAMLCTSSYNDGVFFPGPPWVERSHHALWAGRMEEPKDPLLAVETVSEALKAGIDVRLRMFGSGALESQVAQRIADLGLQGRITIESSAAPDELGKALRDSTVLLHTSRFEGAPRLLVEAIACATPVVTTAAGDPERLIAHENGAVVEERSPERMAAAMAKVLEAGKLADPSTVSDRAASMTMPQLLRACRLEVS